MLGDATTAAQLTPTDRAQGAAIAWAALVAIAERAPAYVVSALVALAQSTYGRYLPAWRAQSPNTTYNAITVDGLYGPKTANAVSLLLANVATDPAMLRTSGWANVFPTKVASTALVQANIGLATTVVNKLSDTTTIYEAIGFQDLGRSVYEAAKRGRTSREAAANATQLLSANAAEGASTQSAANATTVTSTRSTSEGFVQATTAATQTPSRVTPTVPVSSTPGQSLPTAPSTATMTPAEPPVRSGEAIDVTGRRWVWYSDPRVVIPVSLGAFFLLVWGIKYWQKRRSR